MVFATLATSLLLVFLFRLCETYLQDSQLARFAVVVMALSPLAHFFGAPMPDALYLACAVGMLYFVYQGNLWLAAAFGALAGLARTQGLLLIVPALVLLAERQWDTRLSPLRNGISLLRRGWPLVFSVVGALGFTAYRQWAGFPPMTDIYRNYSYSFFVNPLEGYWLNLTWYVRQLPAALGEPNFWALILVPTGLLLLWRTRSIGTPSLLSYTLLHFLLFVSSVNYAWGTNIIWVTQSLGRYSLALFPLTLLLAHWLRSQSRPVRLAAFTLLLAIALTLSARHALGLLGA